MIPNKLKNGAVVLGWFPFGDAAIAICEYNGEFVTWRVYEDNGEYYAESGRYFSAGIGKELARRDFIKRCEEVVLCE
jgi:hypothetical protein